MIQREWVIKASKFCNLRCRYCYEWDHLSDATRMGFDVWAHVLRAAYDFHKETERKRPEETVHTVFFWHGGEPTLLPLNYFQTVIDLQKEVFGKDFIETGQLENIVQTNLYAPRPEIVNLLIDNNFKLGVSLDYIPGVRLTAGGHETENRVRNNMAALRERGVEISHLVVIAGHTAPEIESIYQSALKDGRDFEVLPLFRGPATRPMEGITIDAEEICDAMYRLFVLWYEDGGLIKIKQCEQLLQTSLMHLMGLKRSIYDRAIVGDAVLIVDVDGSLYSPCEEYGSDKTLGNVVSQNVGEIVESPSYIRSLQRDAKKREATCDSCQFLGACDTYPILAANDGYAEQGECRITRPLLERIEAYLRAEGVDRASVQSLVLEEFSVL